MGTSRLIATAIIALGLSGCVTDEYGGNELAGTLIGAGAGGLVGSQLGDGDGRLVATGAGTLIGALIGASAGRSLDRADSLYAERARYEALEHAPTHSAVAWHDPDSGHHGSVEPSRTYRAPSGEYCREYTQTVHIGGRRQEAYGVACRQPDGSWEIID